MLILRFVLSAFIEEDRTQIGLKTQIQIQKSQQNGQYNEIAAGSPYTVLQTTTVANKTLSQVSPNNNTISKRRIKILYL